MQKSRKTASLTRAQLNAVARFTPTSQTAPEMLPFSQSSASKNLGHGSRRSEDCEPGRDRQAGARWGDRERRSGADPVLDSNRRQIKRSVSVVERQNRASRFG